MAKPNESIRLATMAKNSLEERREGRKEAYRLVMEKIAEGDADHPGTAVIYESIRVAFERRSWL